MLVEKIEQKLQTEVLQLNINIVRFMYPNTVFVILVFILIRPIHLQIFFTQILKISLQHTLLVLMSNKFILIINIIPSVKKLCPTVLTDKSNIAKTYRIFFTIKFK